MGHGLNESCTGRPARLRCYLSRRMICTPKGTKGASTNAVSWCVRRCSAAKPPSSTRSRGYTRQNGTRRLAAMVVMERACRPQTLLPYHTQHAMRSDPVRALFAFRPLDSRLQNHKCGLQRHTCGLQNSACGPTRTVLGGSKTTRGFQSACGLQDIACGLQNHVCALQNHACGLHTTTPVGSRTTPVGSRTTPVDSRSRLVGSNTIQHGSF